jgi:hypothetical protein
MELHKWTPASQALLLQVFEALWMLVVRARARARQRHALAGRFARRMVALRLLRAWRQVTRPLASSSGSVSGSGSGASGTERGVAAAREHARLLAIRAVVARADGGPAVVERAQQLPAQDRHRSRGEQPPLDQPQHQQTEQQQHQRRAVQDHLERQAELDQRQAELDQRQVELDQRRPQMQEVVRPEIHMARQEAERWYELQQWQQMLRCLRRWHARVAELRQRRHVREAKQFVRVQGRAPARPTKSAGSAARPRIDQRVFDQRAQSRPAPKRAPRHTPAKSKAQKAREAEAELQQLRDGDTSSLMSEGSSLWQESDCYSGFGFARGRGIGRAPSTGTSSPGGGGTSNPGGGAASRYSESTSMGVEENPSAIWSDASSSSSDALRSFATTAPGDASDAAESTLLLFPEDGDNWREDLHAHEGEMGHDYHERSVVSDGSAIPLRLPNDSHSAVNPDTSAARTTTTRSGFRMRNADLPLPVEQRQRNTTARPMQDSPPPSPGTLARLDPVLREKRFALIFRHFNFWLDWTGLAHRCRAAQVATARNYSRTATVRRGFARWLEVSAASSAGAGHHVGSDPGDGGGDGSSAVSAAVSSVSDPHFHGAVVYNSNRQRQNMVHHAMMDFAPQVVEEEIVESIEFVQDIDASPSPIPETSRNPPAVRTSWEASTLGDDMKEKVRSLLAVQSSIEWDRVFDQASDVAPHKTSPRGASWPWQAEPQPPSVRDQTVVDAASRVANGSAVDQLLSESMTWDADCPAHRSAMATLISPRNQEARPGDHSGSGGGIAPADRPRRGQSGEASWPWQAEPQPPSVRDQTVVDAASRVADGSAVDQLLSESMTEDSGLDIQSISQRTEIERLRKTQADAAVHSELRTSGELDQAVADVAQQIAHLGQTMDFQHTSHSVVDSRGVRDSNDQVGQRARDEQDVISAAEPTQEAWGEIVEERAKLDYARTKPSSAHQLAIDTQPSEASASFVGTGADKVAALRSRSRSPIASPRLSSSPRGYAPKPRLTSNLLPAVATSLRVLEEATHSELCSLSDQAQAFDADNVGIQLKLRAQEDAGAQTLRAVSHIHSPRGVVKDRTARVDGVGGYANGVGICQDWYHQQANGQGQGQGPFAELPPDPLLHILRFLGERDILHGTALVCKAWNAVSLDLSLWGGTDEPSDSYRGIKVDLRQHFLGAAAGQDSIGNEQQSRGRPGPGPRREVLQLRMQRRVQKIPELSLLLQV